MVDLSKVKQCPECGSANIHYDKEKDEILCRDCRAIFSELTPEQEKKFGHFEIKLKSEKNPNFLGETNVRIISNFGVGPSLKCTATKHIDFDIAHLNELLDALLWVKESWINKTVENWKKNQVESESDNA